MLHSPKSSNREALSGIYETHSARVYGFLLARCGSQQLAEDLTADTFVDAAKAIAGGTGASVDGSWLITVARRRLIDHWRRATTREKKIHALRAGELTATSPSIDDLDQELVREALQTLPTRQAAALSLRYLEEMSLTEIAAALGVSYKAAGSLVTRARSSFETAYEELRKST